MGNWFSTWQRTLIGGNGTGWGICAQVSDPSWNIGHFCAYHLALGAESISLYIEAGDYDVVAASMAGIDRVSTFDIRPENTSKRPPGLDQAELRDWCVQDHQKRWPNSHTISIDANAFLFTDQPEQDFSAVVSRHATNRSPSGIRVYEAVYLPTDDIELPSASSGMRTGPREGKESGTVLNKTHGAARNLFHGAFAERHTAPKLHRRIHGFAALRARLGNALRRRDTDATHGFLSAVFETSDFSSWRRRFEGLSLGDAAASDDNDPLARQIKAFQACEGDIEKQRELFWTLHTLIDRQVRLLSKANLFALRPTATQEVSSTGSAGTGHRRRSSPISIRLLNAPLERLEDMREDLRRSDFASFNATLSDMGIGSFYDKRRKLHETELRPDRRMVFIAGLHRSGTTLLEAQLTTRYDVSCLRAKVPENEGQFLQDILPSEQVFGGPGSFAFYEGMKPHPPETEQERRRHRERILSLWENWTTGGSNVLLEKSPPNLTRIPYLRAVFPGSRFVIIVRDPRAVSMSTKRWNNLPPPLLFMHWVTAHSYMLHSLADDCLILRYEDLCSQTEETLGRIAEFAELAPADAAGDLNKRFVLVENQNDKYIDVFGKLPRSIRDRTAFRPWELLGYDLDSHFE